MTSFQELLEKYFFSKIPHPFIQPIFEHLFSQPGKHLRSLLVEKIGDSYPLSLEQKEVLPLAIELIHLSSLVHDDIIDHAPLRRGQKTIHQQWNTQTAILTGDFLFSHSFSLLNKYAPLCLSYASQCIQKMSYSELLQQYFIQNFNLSDQDLCTIIEGKTCALFSLAFLLPALATKESQENLNFLEKAGYHLGMAFQIQDDYLDYFGEEQHLGKPIGGDLLEGKVTLPLLWAFEKREDLLLKAQQAFLQQDFHLFQREITPLDFQESLRQISFHLQKCLHFLSLLQEKKENPKPFQDCISFIQNHRSFYPFHY